MNCIATFFFFHSPATYWGRERCPLPIAILFVENNEGRSLPDYSVHLDSIFAIAICRSEIDEAALLSFH